MKKLLLTGIAVLFLATGTAHAWERSITFQERQLPPKEFDHEYNGTLTLFKELDQKDMPCRHERKRELDELGTRPYACVHANHFGPNTCAIWIMKRDEIEYDGWSYDIIMRHEIGHCNGWHHDEKD